MSTSNALLGSLSIPILGNEDYDKWSLKMRALLGSQECWDIVKDGYLEPDEEPVRSGETSTPPSRTLRVADEELKNLKISRKRNQQALFLLYQGLKNSDLDKIADEKMAKGVWDVLERIYKGETRIKQVRLQTLRGQLETMRMKDGEEVGEYVNRVSQIANQLRRNGEVFSESWVVEKILRSLTGEFENVVCAIEQSKNLKEVSVEELSGSLQAHEA